MDNLTLKFLVVQILEKILRMERFLDNAALMGARSDQEVVNTFKSHLNVIKTEFYFTVRHVGAKKLSENSVPIILRLLATCFHSVDQLHLHLAYVVGQWTSPEARVFVKAVFENFGAGLTKNKDLSVVLSDTYMFEETDLATYLAQRAGISNKNNLQTPTLFLPKVEAENPLQWGTLIHEMGHAVAEKVKTIMTPAEVKAIAGDSEVGTHVLFDWLEETYCDLISLHLLGPAYLASFVEFIMVIGSEGFLEKASATHPHPRMRVFTMFSRLEKRSVKCSFSCDETKPWGDLASLYYKLFEDRCRLEREHLNPPFQAVETLPINVAQFRTCLEAHVEEVVPIDKSLKTFDQRKFSKLSQRLEDGIPIGSYSPVQVEKGDKEALESMKLLRKRLQSGKTENRTEIETHLNSIRSRVRETPCTIAEIVNAGWLYKCEKIYYEALSKLGSFGPEQEEKFKAQLFSLDALLRNSIETSYLNTLFSSHINKEEAK